MGPCWANNLWKEYVEICRNLTKCNICSLSCVMGKSSMPCQAKVEVTKGLDQTLYMRPVRHLHRMYLSTYTIADASRRSCIMMFGSTLPDNR